MGAIRTQLGTAAPADQISPRIEHCVDEVNDDRGRLQQSYNYIDYYFENENAYLRARMYIDKPRVVEMFGPFRPGSVEGVQAAELVDAAHAYLSRRFNRVRKFGTHEL